MTAPHSAEERHARLRPERTRYYPGLDRDRWYVVTRTDDMGVFIDLGSSQLFLNERFLRWEDVEVKEESEKES